MDTGTAFRELKPNMTYYPTVGMKKPGETVRVNFGQEPFAFDIDKVVQDEKAALQAEIAQTKSSPNVSVDETELIHQLVGQYLAHDGYVETARAFAEEIIDEARALANDEDADVPYRSAVEDLDALNRQSECTFVESWLSANMEQKFALQYSMEISTRRSSTPLHTIPLCSVTTKTYISSFDVASSSR